MTLPRVAVDGTAITVAGLTLDAPHARVLVADLQIAIRVAEREERRQACAARGGRRG